MKKLNLFALAILAMGMCMNLTSCDDDDDNVNDEISQLSGQNEESDDDTSDENDIVEEEIENITEVNVETAGTLQSLIFDVSKVEDQYGNEYSNPVFETLKITGELNGDDICYFKNSGCTADKLDLSEARIVEGGGAYYESYEGGPQYFTENDVIGDYMFYELKNIGAIILPNGLTTIGSWAFYGSDFASIIVPDSVTEIKNNAIGYCMKLTEFTFPEKITVLADYVLSQCEHVKTITLPSGLKSIGEGALRCCCSVGEINIPDGVTYIGPSAFYYCNKVEEITIPDGVPAIEEKTFYCCYVLKKVNIGKGVKSIGDRAFYYCDDYLTEITIPDGVTTLGNEVFEYCPNLKKITLGSGLTEVGDYIFESCYSLSELYCNATTPPECTEKTFEKIGNTGTILFYVPQGSSDAYKATSWSYFTNMFEMK